MKLFIDIGGTHLRSEIHGLKDIVYEKLPSSDHDLIHFIEKCLTSYPDICFIGISYAGQVYNGEILSSPNITVSETKIKDHFESRYPLRLEIDNDLNCAVMAEAESLREENIAALYVGTGLGSAVIDQGKLIRGYRNQAFELGHIPYREAPFLCGCGKNNCIELFASGSAIKKWVAHYAPEYESIFASKVTLENLKNSQDEKILPMFEEALVYSAAIVITLFNPEVLVLGGGIMLSNTYLKEIITRNIDKYALSEALKDVKICISTIDDAPLQGALLLKDYNG